MISGASAMGALWRQWLRLYRSHHGPTADPGWPKSRRQPCMEPEHEAIDIVDKNPGMRGKRASSIKVPRPRAIDGLAAAGDPQNDSSVFTLSPQTSA
jgi:hypothetical protein